MWRSIVFCSYCGFEILHVPAYLFGHRRTQSIGIVVVYILSMIKYYKINTFGLICCRIINGVVLFTHVHIKFNDGWWHILYSVYNDVHDIWQYKVMTWPDFFFFLKSICRSFRFKYFSIKMTWKPNVFRSYHANI